MRCLVNPQRVTQMSGAGFLEVSHQIFSIRYSDTTSSFKKLFNVLECVLRSGNYFRCLWWCPNSVQNSPWSSPFPFILCFNEIIYTLFILLLEIPEATWMQTVWHTNPVVMRALKHNGIKEIVVPAAPKGFIEWWVLGSHLALLLFIAMSQKSGMSLNPGQSLSLFPHLLSSYSGLDGSSCWALLPSPSGRVQVHQAEDGKRECQGILSFHVYLSCVAGVL